MQMAGAELNIIATEHGEYCLVPSATQHVIEHAVVFADLFGGDSVTGLLATRRHFSEMPTPLSL